MESTYINSLAVNAIFDIFILFIQVILICANTDMASGGLAQWDGSDKTEIASHIRQVESYFVVKEIDNEAKKVALLHLSLKGEPKTFFTKLSTAQTDTFAHAKAALEERFKPFKTKAQHQQELADRRQRPGETVIELKFAVIDLVSKAYPEVTEPVAQNALVVAHFRKALRPEIRQKLTWTLSDGSSLEDVVLRAAQMEREASSSGINAISSCDTGGVESQSQVKSTSNETSQDRLWKVLNDLTLGQQQLAQTIAVMQAEPRIQPREPRQRTGNCYNCGAPGHFARNCRHKFNPRVPNQGPSNQFNGTCFHCYQWGHKSESCPFRRDGHPGNDRGLGGMANSSQPKRS